MKTLALTIAAAATVLAGAAHAASTSNADGDVRVFNPNAQTLFGGAALDTEPTASIGAGLSSGGVFTEEVNVNGRRALIRYSVEGGQKNIISKSFRSSSE